MRNLNLGEGIVILIALAAVCVAVDGFVASRSSAWFGYAPNRGTVFDSDGGRTKVLVVRAALAAAWGAAGLFLLRTPKP